MTFEELIDDKSREKLNNIIEARKQAEQSEHEEWLKKQEAKREADKKFVEATYFKTADEMIEWVMSGKSIYSEYGDEMKVNDDRTHIGHYGQHSDGDDCYFWYDWHWVSTDEWTAWVRRIAEPKHLEFGYLPAWGKMKRWQYEELTDGRGN